MSVASSIVGATAAPLTEVPGIDGAGAPDLTLPEALPPKYSGAGFAVTSDRELLVKCPGCSLRFVAPQGLHLNMLQQHMTDPRGRPCVDPRCPVSIRVFNKATHLRQHAVQSRNKCRFCSFSCRTKTGLTSHHLMHQRAVHKRAAGRPVPRDGRSSGQEQRLDDSDDGGNDGTDTGDEDANAVQARQQRPRPKGVPSQHLSVRLIKYRKVDTKKNTAQDIANFRLPLSCFVCGLVFEKSCNNMEMALHYYDIHRKLVPLPCPFPKCPQVIRLVANMLPHVKNHLWRRRYSCTACSYSADWYGSIKVHATAHEQQVSRTAPALAARKFVHIPPPLTHLQASTQPISPLHPTTATRALKSKGESEGLAAPGESSTVTPACVKQVPELVNLRTSVKQGVKEELFHAQSDVVSRIISRVSASVTVSKSNMFAQASRLKLQEPTNKNARLFSEAKEPKKNAEILVADSRAFLNRSYKLQDNSIYQSSDIKEIKSFSDVLAASQEFTEPAAEKKSEQTYSNIMKVEGMESLIEDPPLF